MESANAGVDARGRVEGFLVGAVVGASLAALTSGATDAEGVRRALVGGAVVPCGPPPGRRMAPVALGDALLEELVSGGVDLRRLAGRWVTWRRADGLEADDALCASLDHLEAFDAPRHEAGGSCVAALAAALPAALTANNPQAMIAGAFHVSGLLDPDESTALASVAAVVAASRLLAGYRDFIPDVLAVLRANDAPDRVVQAFARVPRDPRLAPPVPGSATDAIDAASWVFWMVHHRPRSVAALEQMVLAGGVPVVVGSLLGALLGARDGVAGWPAGWMDESGEDVVLRRALGTRLAGGS